jgi:hypothetical protein
MAILKWLQYGGQIMQREGYTDIELGAYYHSEDVLEMVPRSDENP